MKLALILFIIFLTNFSLGKDYSENELKAIYIVRFMNFIELPDSLAESPKINITVLGDSPVFHDLNIISKTYKIKNKKFKVNQITDIETPLSPEIIENTHVLYISQNHLSKVSKINKIFHSTRVLTIGESEDFINSGVLISFYRYKNNIRFKIDFEVMKNTELLLSSQLLKLGK